MKLSVIRMCIYFVLDFSTCERSKHLKAKSIQALPSNVHSIRSRNVTNDIVVV